MSETAPRARIIHAGCVALGNRGVLILGSSGTGKSALALQLMAFGCELVSDDRTALATRGGIVVAAAPLPIRGKIEARGVGILNARARAAARVVVVVDMNETEGERLPPMRTYTLLGAELPLLHRVESPHFPAAILQYLKGGRSA
ncbi:MAG: serine kinase [Proteobacteria bacterium]|nr:serine kinase [Pseudomonadota bacterium]